MWLGIEINLVFLFSCYGLSSTQRRVAKVPKNWIGNDVETLITFFEWLEILRVEALATELLFLANLISCMVILRIYICAKSLENCLLGNGFRVNSRNHPHVSLGIRIGTECTCTVPIG